MSIQIADATYVPDLDGARIPGALIGMTGFAPLQRGPYGSVGVHDTFAMTGEDALLVKTFRQVGDTVRLLVFRKENIDEYDNAGARTNLNTGYSASTTSWDAAAWGNNIYACNKLDATQVSTGTTFAPVGDDAPKARYIAANVNFVMLADTDDGADDLADQVWWSALQDPTEWTPSIATQAGKVRLLDAPGPIVQLIAFRDMFVAWKRNSTWIGEYIGPPFVFQWRMVSSRIGLAAPNGVVELDDKLYWVHDSGFYEWDGAQLRNVGLPVFQMFLNTFGFSDMRISGHPPTGEVGSSIGLVRAVADDIEGCVWFSCYTRIPNLGLRSCMYPYGYNPRTQKWSALGRTTQVCTNPSVWVETTQADMRTFLGDATIDAQARIWYADNVVSFPKLRELRYPNAWTSDIAGTASTAVQGTPERSTDAMRVYARCLAGSDTAPFSACTLYGYANEQRNLGAQTAACVLNTELESFDGRLSARYKLASLTGTTDKWCILAGIGIEYPQTGSR